VKSAYKVSVDNAATDHGTCTGDSVHCPTIDGSRSPGTESGDVYSKAKWNILHLKIRQLYHLLSKRNKLQNKITRDSSA
jgi:hypothetical protein